jgi:hypothetical protein
VFLDEGYCAAAAVELDPEEGCITYSASGEAVAEDAWDEDESSGDEDWEEAGFVAEGEDELEGEEEDEEDEDELDEDDT